MSIVIMFADKLVVTGLLAGAGSVILVQTSSDFGPSGVRALPFLGSYS